MDFTGKVALVTGGGTGIGRATSLQLARAGAVVAVNYSRSEREAHETVSEIEQAGGRAAAFKANVANHLEIETMVRDIHAAFGRIDMLVNNAGTTRFITLSDLDAVTDEVWDDILAVNVKGAFFCARAVAPHMREVGGGAIVNVSSIAGFSGTGSSLPYAVSKSAMIGLTKSLARALAPQIRVNSVAPGIVKTRWVAGRDEHIDQLSGNALLKTTASPEQVAAMVCTLLSNEAVTGQTVVVDAGEFLH